MEGKRKLQAALAAALLLGLLLGTALPELLRMGTGSYAGFVSLYSFNKFQETSPDTRRLFFYLVPVRIKALLFLWMSAYTAAGVLFHCFYLFWLACSAGMLLSLFILRDGYEGILLFLCCLFPQWLLYGSVWKRELGIFFRRLEGRGYREGGTVSAVSGRDLRELGEMGALCVFGCGVEAWLGLWTLKIFLRMIP